MISEGAISRLMYTTPVAIIAIDTADIFAAGVRTGDQSADDPLDDLAAMRVPGQHEADELLRTAIRTGSAAVRGS